MVALVKAPLLSRHPRFAASTNNLSNSLLSSAVHVVYFTTPFPFSFGFQQLLVSLPSHYNHIYST
ncbi:hypothetical protein Syun_012935 [Stephania yunnanensis]|uniref:Uncharacterized protein n=1 Tax=Stephania yunnanensis TaxID=152371 RepID=A0AAP0K2K7_9MAGN